MKFEQENSVREENLLWNEEKCQDRGLQRGNFYAHTPPCLSDYFVDKYSSNGDIIADLFAGRGTTGISALEQGRRAIVNDLNPLTCLFAHAKRVRASKDNFIKILHEGLGSNNYKDGFEGLNLNEMPSFIDPKKDLVLINLAEYLNTFETEDEEIQKAILWARFLLTEIILERGESFYFSPKRSIAKRKTFLKRNLTVANASQFLFDNILESFISYQPFMLDKKAELICQNEDAALWTNPCKQEIQLFLTLPPELNTQVYVGPNALKLWLSGFSAEKFKNSLFLLDNLDSWSFYMGRVLKQQRKFLAGQGHNIWLLADGSSTQESLQPALLTQAKLNNYQLIKRYKITIQTKAKKIGSSMNIIAFVLKPGV